MKEKAQMQISKPTPYKSIDIDRENLTLTVRRYRVDLYGGTHEYRVDLKFINSRDRLIQLKNTIFDQCSPMALAEFHLAFKELFHETFGKTVDDVFYPTPPTVDWESRTISNPKS